MDQNSENIHNFESLLKNRSLKKPLALYISSEHKDKHVNSSKTSKITAKEVLANVSRQVKALQNADTMGYKRVGNPLDKYKTREFLPVDMIPVDRVVLHKQPTKFETQCVTDTQLISIIENAEIVDKHRGVTQEFDQTFCQNSDNECDDERNDSRLKANKEADKGNDAASEIMNIDRSNVSKEHNGLNDKDSRLFENSNDITCEMDTITCYQNDVITDFNDDVNASQETKGFNKCVEFFDIFKENSDRPVSPVLNTYRKITTSPLIVDLYTFEKFENLANPIIEEQGDLTVAKNMINSQILGREIMIPAHKYENFGRDSPVISKINCITTHLNKDDNENICTCSNNCIGKHVKCTNASTNEDIILTSGSKKTQSKIAKTEIKDEILFSSDEESEYLHKSIQELPLTCALETSFYDGSDVLDKTMYVGFQTASNKSIQINTDSFTKAKSILSDINYEKTGTTISDLVEIFDSGKAVSENVQSVELTSNTLECGTDNKTFSKIEHINKNLVRSSKNLNKIGDKRDDTLEDINITALERDMEVNDDIVLSQVINFKSTLRSVKLNDSIMSTEKVRDTFDNVSLTALEQNKETDDDIMMSQVITFKSIPRTPNIAPSVGHESLQMSKLIAKRKLEGFKTASNKKIKLSDKALARCKKVFQDIDLGDSEFVSSESNFTKPKKYLHDDFETDDFNVSFDASKSSSEMDHITIERENDIRDKEASSIIISEVCDSETALKDKEKHPEVVLQLNDQIILKEFEENEMPLGETNNNACVFFKTANNKNFAVSNVAIAGIVATTNNSVSTIKTTDQFIDSSGKGDNVFKKPAAEFQNVATKRTKSSTDDLTNEKVSLPQKQEDNHVIYDARKPPIEFVRSKIELKVQGKAKINTENISRDLDKELTQNINKEGSINSNIGKKTFNNVEDEFNCGIDTQDFLAEELTRIEEFFKDNSLENEKPTAPIFQGFQTASRKTIAISEKALENSRKLFEDITNENFNFKCRSTEENLEEHDHSRKRETQKSKDKRTALEICDNETQLNFSNNDMRNKTPVFTGFQTASNKKVCVSKKSIEATKAILQDIALSNQNNERNERFTEFSTFGSGSNNVTNLEHNNVTLHDIKISKTVQDEFLKENHTMLSEFRTDKNKSTELKNVNKEAHIFEGFKTASAKPIRTSADAMKKTKRLFSEFDVNDYGHHPEPPTSIFVGFQTASNKKINISAEALATSKQLLTDFELKDKKSHNDDHDKIETNNLDIYPEGKSDSYKETGLNNESCRPSMSKFIGFRTASKKAVNISEKKLAKSKQIFQHVDIFDKESDALGEEITTTKATTSPVFKGFQTANNRKDSFSEKAVEKSKNVFDDVVNYNFPDNAPAFQGFQTASNKKVDISEKALTKSRKLFEDINLSQLNKLANMPLVSNGLHSIKDTSTHEKILTKTVEVPDQAFAKNNALVVEKGNGAMTPVYRGFQTASNKPVKVSEKALAKSKKLFEDINLSQFNTDPKITLNTDIINDAKDTTVSNHEDKFEGIQTTSKTVKETDEAFSKSQALTAGKDIDANIPVFTGFQTASNRQVKISEKALENSKKLFEDIRLSQFDNDIKDPTSSNHERKFAGFQTASNKKVMVSDQALAKTKDMFKNVHAEIDNNTLTNEKATMFKAFQTASNKNVAISEKALEKSKKIFEDINLSQIEKEPTTKVDLNSLRYTKTDDVINTIKAPDNLNENSNFGSFQTASNKKVKISEQALAKTKDIFKDIPVQKGNDILRRKSELKTPAIKVNAGSIMSKNNYFSPIASKIDNTNDINGGAQVLNDFESTLNTEDFSKNTPVSNRSGSPILSCPRAKKRKFETPYRTSKKMHPRNVFEPPKLAKTYTFNKEYKKYKKYTLKDIEKLEKEYTKINVDPYILEFKFDGLLNFIFKDERNDYTDKEMSVEELKRIFLDSVNNKIVPEGWLDNHIKLIVWKQLSYEVKFSSVMKNTCTVRNVLEQLKYRYDRELYHVQRPILRKILEKDEVPSKTMVLCVVGIFIENVSVISVPPSSQNVELLLTDGWYCVRACLDRMLMRLVASGAIVVGTKIAVCGAELINCEQGVAPWEDTSSVRLKLHGNSTRRARWRASLGPRPDLVPCGLGDARADGGRAAVLRLAVTRVYPPMTVERMDDGSTVTLSERLEHIRQMKYESERQAIMEKLYEEVEKEMSDLESQDSEGCSNEKGCIDSGSQIAKCIKKSKDPDEYRSHLTKSQSRMLEDYDARHREKLAERLRERFQEKLEKNGLKNERNVVQLVKVRVADFAENSGSVKVTKGFLSMWRPSAAVLELVTEGAWIEVLNVIPTGVRNSEIQLSAGRQTIFNPYKQKNEKYKLYANTLQRKCYEIKEITQNPSITTDYNEIDTAGMIFCIEPSTKEFKEQSFQNVYLADADKNMICVNFWGGLKKFGYENILDTGQIITCVNLQKRAGNSRKSIPQYRVTEFSYFTKTPKSKRALEVTNELSDKLSKIKDKFCEDCIVLKNNYSIFKTRYNENVSPYRFEYNIPKNLVSPGCDANLNLTGLDFESSFNSQDVSPQVLLRKKKVNEKIEKIRLNYGEPPPLSTMHIINKSKNASATYRSPLLSDLERSKTPLQTVASPVNRTFVKNVNPVKLNFSNVLNESVDHFAEDFDTSPPLSLDSDILDK